MKKYLLSTVTALALSAAFTSTALSAEAETEDDFRFQAQYGLINPFYGSINPFYGLINPFYGHISPFWGDISPFWGDINPFYGMINPFWGDIHPFWGDIQPFSEIDEFHAEVGPFWAEVGPMWGNINAFWGDISAFDDGAGGDYEVLRSDLDALFNRAARVFGEAVEDKTKLSFRHGFLNQLLADFELDLDDPDSLAAMSAADRALFFLHFYDGLMSFTEADRVDHWMATVNWSPSLSQAAGGGDKVLVGIIDFSLPHSAEVKADAAGLEDYLNVNHGYAVAGLIGAPHDDEGVMGLAPDADLSVYNPFDETLTAGWADVRNGLRFLLDGKPKDRADIINLSLGVEGWTFHPDWARVLGGAVADRGSDTLFVMAAGNSGVVQQDDVDFSRRNLLDNILVVGSVNPSGELSRFSNRPGDACLTVQGECQPGHRLMDRFLVAPGELILVGDGAEGDEFVRMSGTSFAAPIVSGAAALVWGRWPWLQASDVANALLWSATDLGDPGVDAEYGWGLLNVDAAMSPINSDALYHFADDDDAEHVHGMGLVLRHVDIKADADDSIVVFEEFGTTFRDFEIPLSDLVENEAGDETARRRSAAYHAERVFSYSNGASFTDVTESQRMVTRSGELSISAFASSSDPMQQRSEYALGYQTGVQVADTSSGRSLRFGVGEGALAFNAHDSFGLFSDHRPDTGGVNPVLGLASGGAFSVLRFAQDTKTSFNFGMTHNSETMEFTNPITGESEDFMPGLPGYRASAIAAGMAHEFSSQLRMSVGYTLLGETGGFLGAQGAGVLAMEETSFTDAITVGAERDFGQGLTLSASTTVARSRSGELATGTLAVSDAPMSTAYQVTAHLSGVFAQDDGLRVSVIQPLHVEGGALEYSSMRVVDRATGDLANVTQTWDLGGDRLVQMEMLYTTPLFSDQVELSFFGRVDLSDAGARLDDTALSSGARFRLEF